jgi:pimeloyl-ACP methyl ester carboxylesterase
MGLGMQLLGWEPEFCEQLAERGFHVVRYDNRDIGLSTGFDEAGVPDIAAVIGGDRTGVPYLLEDLADDADGLLAGLGVDAAHVVGVSMGGMIVQELAIRHPERVRSLCSIMSTTGSYSVGQPTPEALAALTAPPGVDRDSALARGLRTWQILQSPAYPKTDEEHLATLAAAYDRAYHPAGSARQLGAILASADRTDRLRKLDVPTQVIHGEADPLIDASGGRATAEAIPGARLMLVPGMGHDMPEQLWGAYIDAIVENARRAERS